jgi:hypothetical protein
LKPINTSKDEDLLLVNDADSRIMIFSSPTNLKFLCDDVSEIYADGTFKWCPKFFTQLYTIHGSKNGHYLQLGYCLRFVGELKIIILESASFTNNKSSSLLVFIGFKKFKTSLTSSIEEGSLGNYFRLSLYSA